MMSLTTEEILADVGNFLVDLSTKVAIDSDGGVSITLSEWIDAGEKFGLQIVKDIAD
jgi:hypothetical protein